MLLQGARCWTPLKPAIVSAPSWGSTAPPSGDGDRLPLPGEGLNCGGSTAEPPGKGDGGARIIARLRTARLRGGRGGSELQDETQKSELGPRPSWLAFTGLAGQPLSSPARQAGTCGDHPPCPSVPPVLQGRTPQNPGVLRRAASCSTGLRRWAGVLGARRCRAPAGVAAPPSSHRTPPRATVLVLPPWKR